MNPPITGLRSEFMTILAACAALFVASAAQAKTLAGLADPHRWEIAVQRRVELGGLETS